MWLHVCVCAGALVRVQHATSKPAQHFLPQTLFKLKEWQLIKGFRSYPLNEMVKSRKYESLDFYIWLGCYSSDNHSFMSLLAIFLHGRKKKITSSVLKIEEARRTTASHACLNFTTTYYYLHHLASLKAQRLKDSLCFKTSKINYEQYFSVLVWVKLSSFPQDHNMFILINV